MKKILFLINNLGEGGAEKVLITLVRNLDKSKYNITVMTLFDIGVNKNYLPNDVNYITHYKSMTRGNSHIMKLFSPKTLHRHFIKDRYDIEIAFLEGPCARIISGCENKNTKLVSWTHCTWHSEREFAQSFRSLKEARDCCQKFDKNVFVSKGVREAFEKYCQVDNKEVIYNVIDSDRIKQLAKEPVREVVIKEDEFNIISVGKIIPVKGYDRLARIHKRLLDGGYKVHTYILGIGGKQRELEDYCRENGIQDSFTFLGYHQNPYQYMNKADLFVCSSLSEGLSTAVTEALITGVPVVTTDVSGMRELLGDSEYGIITENNENALHDSIRKLIDNRELMEEQRNKAVERGKMFDLSQTVSSVQDMLDSL
ncbi:MAG: glycosyltransferase [Parasporobacterium sp.]|nr:glycosyltransferase [Parasporobacterium sp.]